MGSRRCFTGAVCSRVSMEKVARREGERIWRGREDLEGREMVEKMSSSCWAEERNSRREERISIYGVMVSGVLVFIWVVR